uniref:Uncharacterized protein n=1 Tax=viral metagenome TaxID=1070528 RepID=A0A2V0R9N2_9ZZZZ
MDKGFINMIHAASASGKTTYLSKGKKVLLDKSLSGENNLIGYDHEGLLMMDGDLLIAFYSSWPSATNWWQSDARSVAHAHMYATILTGAVKIIKHFGYSQICIFFNGGMADRDKVEELYIENDPGMDQVNQYFVEIDEATHRSFVEHRWEERETRTPSERKKAFVFPATFGDMKNNRLATRSLARSEGQKVHPSFDSVISTISKNSNSASKPLLVKEPKKSVDGLRTYNINMDLEEALGVLDTLFKKWPWDGTFDGLVEKLVEEAHEAQEGGSEGPTAEDNGVISVIGTSAYSEAITVAIVAAKIANTFGTSVTDFIKLMAVRHTEQFERYNS